MSIRPGPVFTQRWQVLALGLPPVTCMKHDEHDVKPVVVIVLALALVLLPLPSTSAFTQQSQVSIEDKRALAVFEGRVKEYVKLREKVARKLPKLSAKSTPEQIEAYKTAFQELVRAARPNAKPGDVFTPDIATRIRALIRTEFKGKERQDLRETVLEANTQGVPTRVNYVYPETKELTQIPPTLLLEVPQLPKELRYRFVGHHLLLVDRENNVIVDYMLKALP